MDILLAHVANVGRPRAEQNLAIYHPDLVTEFPFAPEGHTRRLEGVDALSGFLAAIADFATNRAVRDVATLVEGSRFVITYVEASVFGSTGKPYSSEILWRGELAEGRIASLAEYYDPIRVLAALED